MFDNQLFIQQDIVDKLARTKEAMDELDNSEMTYHPAPVYLVQGGPGSPPVMHPYFLSLIKLAETHEHAFLADVSLPRGGETLASRNRAINSLTVDEAQKLAAAVAKRALLHLVGRMFATLNSHIFLNDYTRMWYGVHCSVMKLPNGPMAIDQSYGVLTYDEKNEVTYPTMGDSPTNLQLAEEMINSTMEVQLIITACRGLIYGATDHVSGQPIDVARAIKQIVDIAPYWHAFRDQLAFFCSGQTIDEFRHQDILPLRETDHPLTTKLRWILVMTAIHLLEPPCDGKRRAKQSNQPINRSAMSWAPQVDWTTSPHLFRVIPLEGATDADKWREWLNETCLSIDRLDDYYKDWCSLNTYKPILAIAKSIPAGGLLPNDRIENVRSGTILSHVLRDCSVISSVDHAAYSNNNSVRKAKWIPMHARKNLSFEYTSDINGFLVLSRLVCHVQRKGGDATWTTENALGIITTYSLELFGRSRIGGSLDWLDEDRYYELPAWRIPLDSFEPKTVKANLAKITKGLEAEKMSVFIPEAVIHIDPVAHAIQILRSGMTPWRTGFDPWTGLPTVGYRIYKFLQDRASVRYQINTSTMNASGHRKTTLKGPIYFVNAYSQEVNRLLTEATTRYALTQVVVGQSEKGLQRFGIRVSTITALSVSLHPIFDKK